MENIYRTAAKPPGSTARPHLVLGANIAASARSRRHDRPGRRLTLVDFSSPVLSNIQAGDAAIKAVARTVMGR